MCAVVRACTFIRSSLESVGMSSDVNILTALFKQAKGLQAAAVAVLAAVAMVVVVEAAAALEEICTRLLRLGQQGH